MSWIGIYNVTENSLTGEERLDRYGAIPATGHARRLTGNSLYVTCACDSCFEAGIDCEQSLQTVEDLQYIREHLQTGGEEIGMIRVHQ